MEFAEFAARVRHPASRRRSDGQRWGQWAINYLMDVRPSLAMAVAGHPDYDPFYDDSKVEPFLTKLKEIW